jgi:hypothetical protein
MKQGSTVFLRLVVCLMGLAGLAFCVVVLPRIIGSVDTGGYDPILLGMYVTAIPFFVALYHTLKLLSYIDKNNAFSGASVTALKYIKYCAGIISASYAVGMPYIFFVADKDDAPGAVLIGLVLASAPLVVAVFAAVLQKLLQNAIDIKAENDLTV